ncbi:ATP-binding protein [Natrialbaceae archaeon GCM10025810]|uniref:ATP-binding protein n=1 Tax=Halovalidus salilacus TaxID=3075124 RepID=UPI00362154E1
MSEQRRIVIGETSDGAEVTLPVVEILTGRGFVTGKSGSGKSNTASVIAEELLEAGFPLLIVDTDGEYYGLKEEYEMLHAGADEECDIQIGPEHAEQMATLALEENVPVILDVSGYLDEDEADELLRETARQLFVKEKKLKKPFLLVVEEVHEYIPEGGGVGETGNLLIKIGKRGRKHGLGILGISQRPADVKKDFITQANWLVWHRLTWENDTNVVGRIIDTEYKELVSDLDDGQAFVQTDWTDVAVRKIQFRRKRTFDAGATPGLDDFERPELKSVSDALVGELQDISEKKDREENRILELENELEKKETRIETLEDELDSARDISNAAKQMADALTKPQTFQTQFPDAGATDEMRRLHDELVEIEREREELEETVERREDRIAELEDRLEAEASRNDLLEAENEQLREHIGVLESRLDAADGVDPNVDVTVDAGGVAEAGDGSDSDGDAGDAEDAIIHGDGNPVEFGYVSVDEDESEPAPLVVPDEERRLEELFEWTELGERLEVASDQSRCTVETARRVMRTLMGSGPAKTEEVAAEVDRSVVAVQSLLSELRTEGLVDRTDERTYAIDPDIRVALSTVGAEE